MALWQKGQSGNPKGKPPGFAGLAAKIRKETDGGAELVAFALQVFRGQPLGEDMRNPTLQQRIDAMIWLTDRGFGKAVTPIDLTTTDGNLPALPFDPARLSMTTLEELVAATAPPIDVEAVEE